MSVKTTDDVVGYAEDMIENEEGYEDNFVDFCKDEIQMVIFSKRKPNGDKLIKDRYYAWLETEQFILNEALVLGQNLLEIPENVLDRMLEEAGIKFNASFKGIIGFAEFEDNEVYCPSSYRCLFKLLKRHISDLNLGVWGVKIIKELDDEKYMNGITIENFRKKCKESSIKLPKIFEFRSDCMWNVTDKNNIEDINEARIYCLPTTYRGHFHCVLMKAGKKLDFIEVTKRIKLEVMTKFDLSDDMQYKCTERKKEKVHPRVFAFDFESYIKTEFRRFKNGKVKEMKKQIPYMVSYGECFVKNHDCKFIKGEDCADRMIEDIITRMDKKAEGFILYSFNGGRYDTILVKETCKKMKWKNTIELAGKIMQLVGSRDGFTVDFRDIRDYLPGIGSLSDCLKAYKCKMQKFSFDIQDKTKEWYDDNMNIVNENGVTVAQYCVRDTESLVELCEKVNVYMNKFDVDIRDMLSASGVAWRLMMRNCYHLQFNTYIVRDPITAAFMRMASKGGRVVAYKRKLIGNSGLKLVCLDGNALYPSAMFLYMFPIGVARVITSEEDYNNIVKEGKMYIAELIADIPNRKKSITPIKTEAKELIYDCGEVQDVWTSVDVEDMVHDGAKVKKFIRGLYWDKKAYIFREFIERFHKERMEFQKSPDPEVSVMAGCIKVITNSAYGKMLEKNDRKIEFIDEKLVRQVGDKLEINNHSKFMYAHEPIVKKINDKQYQVKAKIDDFKESKPLHLGAFILSYSKRIMNNFMRMLGMDNIFYTDTDSIYVDESKITDEFRLKYLYRQPDGSYFPNIEAMNDELKLKEGKIPEKKYLNLALGGLKNDYGPGKYVDEARFYGIKRCLLHFSEEDKVKKIREAYNAEHKTDIQRFSSYKAKFTGLYMKSVRGMFADFVTNELETKVDYANLPYEDVEKEKKYNADSENEYKILTDFYESVYHCKPEDLVNTANVVNSFLPKKCKELKKTVAEKVFNPIKSLKVLQQRWTRGLDGVRISDEAFIFNSDFKTRCKYYKDDYRCLHYDKKKPDVPLNPKPLETPFDNDVYNFNYENGRLTCLWPLKADKNLYITCDSPVFRSSIFTTDKDNISIDNIYSFYSNEDGVMIGYKYCPYGRTNKLMTFETKKCHYVFQTNCKTLPMTTKSHPKLYDAVRARLMILGKNMAVDKIMASLSEMAKFKL